MSHSFTLCCWVRGDAVHENLAWLPTPPNATVETLKTLLVNCGLPVLSGSSIEPNTLMIHKPPKPVPHPYLPGLTNLLISDLGLPLDPSSNLAELFDQPPPERHIHLIVDARLPLPLDYWLRGTSFDDAFSIEVHDNIRTSKLRERIKEENSALTGVLVDRIRLFKVSGDEQELRECLDKIDEGTPLKGPYHLRNSPLCAPLLGPYRLVVQVNDHPRSTNRPPLTYGRNATASESDQVRVAREAFDADRPEKVSPSSASRPSAFRRAQKDAKTRIPCGRPREPEETIPPTLLHPVFGEFTDHIRNAPEMTEHDNNFASHLSDAMSELYDDETQRVAAVNKIFKSAHLDFRIGAKVAGTNYATDADISIALQEVHQPYVIAEFKNEAAASTSDSYVQAAAYYFESTRKHAPKMSASALPCFLLMLDGSTLTFAAAVWNLRPVVQVLSHPLSFHYHTTDTDNQLTTARHMAAFRKAIRSLKEYYQRVTADSLVNTARHSMLFPYPTSFNPLDAGSEDAVSSFRYKGQLASKTKLLFFGDLLDGDKSQICIKFVRRYSPKAHQHCASQGWAPRLRGFEALPGGWYMVVMDRLVGYDTLSDIPKTERLPKSMFESIGEQLKKLHDANMVHGDMRAANILIKKDDRMKFMAVDFDWAGDIGHVRYPPHVNYLDVARPEDVRDGNLIQAVQDDGMLGIVICERER